MSTFANRLDQLEEQVCHAAYLRYRRAEPADTTKEYGLLQQQIVALGSMGCKDATDNSRMMALMIMCAYLRRDLPTVSVFTDEILKELAGKDTAMTVGEAYLFLGLFMTTRNPSFRNAGKLYIQQHDDVSPMLRRLFSLARNVKVRKSATVTKQSFAQQKQASELTDKQVIVAHLNEELTAWTTDGMPDYRLATLEPALQYKQEYNRLAASFRPEYTPQPTDTLEQLRSRGGIALARHDLNLITKAFQIAEERLNATDNRDEQMQILDTMYHIAGCDSSLLMESLKQRCDKYFNQFFRNINTPTGLFPDEPDKEAVAYHLLFCHHQPKVGAHSYQRTPASLRWLSTLRRWADKLVEQNGGIWQEASLAANFRLQRYILQTGSINVAVGNKRKATAYRNHINGAFFDCYLQLVNEKQPGVQALVCCYQMFREWKYDIAANEDRYAEFMRVMTKRQRDYKPDTTAWLQLEEIKVDYATNKQDDLRYKLVCND